jgi:hypothetical protein
MVKMTAGVVGSMVILNPQRRSRKPAAPGRLIERDPELPWCSNCRTDEFLIYEEFVPASVAVGSRDVVAASVSYSCSVCGRFNGHEVPPTWSPPNWFWYN